MFHTEAYIHKRIDTFAKFTYLFQYNRHNAREQQISTMQEALQAAHAHATCH